MSDFYQLFIMVEIVSMIKKKPGGGGETQP